MAGDTSIFATTPQTARRRIPWVDVAEVFLGFVDTDQDDGDDEQVVDRRDEGPTTTVDPDAGG